jgi:hypothetical protein
MLLLLLFLDFGFGFESKTPKIRLQKFFNFFLDLILDEEKLKNY